MTKEQHQQFEEACKPLMKFLAENCNPHTVVNIDSQHAELLSGEAIFSTDEFLKD